MKFARKDMGDAAEASSGGGLKGTLRELLKVGLLSLVVLAVIWVGLGILAELAIRAITPEDEAEILRALAPELEIWEPDEPPYHTRAELVKTTLEKFRELPEVPRLPYNLVFLDEEEPNAFALPGGTIGVTRGLLDALGDEEIPYAFVIGHELGHFKNRDHLRGLVRDTGAAASAAMLFGSSGASPLVANAGSLLELRYSRQQEYAADDFGISLVRKIYPHTDGAERLFEVLSAEGEPPAWAYMFFTHPDTRERIRRIRPIEPPAEE